MDKKKFRKRNTAKGPAPFIIGNTRPIKVSRSPSVTIFHKEVNQAPIPYFMTISIKKRTDYFLSKTKTISSAGSKYKIFKGYFRCIYLFYIV